MKNVHGRDSPIANQSQQEKGSMPLWGMNPRVAHHWRDALSTSSLV